MKWLWLVGGGSVVAIIAVAAVYFMGLGGVVKVIRSILGAIGDAADTARKWLRQPGNKTRGACAFFALLFVAAGLQSWQRGTIIVQQRADYTRLKQTTDQEKAALAEQVTDRESTIARFTELARQQKLLLEQAARENATALAEAKAAQAHAAESEKKYQDAFLQRPPECKAALEVMAAACPTLNGY